MITGRVATDWAQTHLARRPLIFFYSVILATAPPRSMFDEPILEQPLVDFLRPRSLSRHSVRSVSCRQLDLRRQPSLQLPALHGPAPFSLSSRSECAWLMAAGCSWRGRAQQRLSRSDSETIRSAARRPLLQRKTETADAGPTRPRADDQRGSMNDWTRFTHCAALRPRTDAALSVCASPLTAAESAARRPPATPLPPAPLRSDLQ